MTTANAKKELRELKKEQAKLLHKHKSASRLEQERLAIVDNRIRVLEVTSQSPVNRTKVREQALRKEIKDLGGSRTSHLREDALLKMREALQIEKLTSDEIQYRLQFGELARVAMSRGPLSLYLGVIQCMQPHMTAPQLKAEAKNLHTSVQSALKKIHVKSRYERADLDAEILNKYPRVIDYRIFAIGWLLGHPIYKYINEYTSPKPMRPEGHPRLLTMYESFEWVEEWREKGRKFEGMIVLQDDGSVDAMDVYILKKTEREALLQQELRKRSMPDKANASKTRTQKRGTKTTVTSSGVQGGDVTALEGSTRIPEYQFVTKPVELRVRLGRLKVKQSDFRQAAEGEKQLTLSKLIHDTRLMDQSKLREKRYNQQESDREQPIRVMWGGELASYYPDTLGDYLELTYLKNGRRTTVHKKELKKHMRASSFNLTKRLKIRQGVYKGRIGLLDSIGSNTNKNYYNLLLENTRRQVRIPKSYTKNASPISRRNRLPPSSRTRPPPSFDPNTAIPDESHVQKARSVHALWPEHQKIRDNKRNKKLQSQLAYAAEHPETRKWLFPSSKTPVQGHAPGPRVARPLNFYDNPKKVPMTDAQFLGALQW